MRRLLTRTVLLLRGPVRDKRSAQRAGTSRQLVLMRWKKTLARTARLAGAGVLMFVVAAALVLIAPQVRDGLDRPIRQVRILSDLYYQDPEAVRQVIANSRLDRFSLVPIDALREGITGLEWVQQAHVRRVWPDTLEVRVREQIPMARWGDQHLLNERGDLFETTRHAEFVQLPILRGPEGSTARVLAMHQRIAPLLGAQGLRMAELRLSRRGAWDLTLENGALVRLGRAEVIERVSRFVAFYERKLAGKINTVAIVDTRYSNGIAVTWAPGQVVEEEASS